MDLHCLFKRKSILLVRSKYGRSFGKHFFIFFIIKHEPISFYNFLNKKQNFENYYEKIHTKTIKFISVKYISK